MSNREQYKADVTVILDPEAMATAIERVAHEIVSANPDMEAVVLLGILRRGRPLAERIAARISDLVGAAPQVGSLATTLYRDDLRAGIRPVKVRTAETHFDFNVDGVTVILVDDVIAAGRTIRAALDEVMDYGRPTRIQLACLVDRGLREVPIQPDYCGVALVTKPQDHIAVRLLETDGEDVVLHIHTPRKRMKEASER